MISENIYKSEPFSYNIYRFCLLRDDLATLGLLQLTKKDQHKRGISNQVNGAHTRFSRPISSKPLEGASWFNPNKKLCENSKHLHRDAHLQEGES